MFDPPVEISYRTTVEIPRPGAIGNALRWLGNHPVWGGLGCGVAVVIIAAVRRPGGVAAEPLMAGLISASVIAVWMILFYLMRGFFEAQSVASKSVLRRLVIDADRARWFEDDEPRRDIAAPRVRLLTNPVPDGIGEEQKGSRKEATAWPVWLVVDSRGDESDERLILETRDAARRARDYGEVTGDIVEETDERLPRAIARPILQAMER